MTDLMRLLKLMRPYRGWLLLGILLSFITLLANVALMAVSGWFITAMALAGVAGVSMNYFTPAAVIRACAIVRTVGRYGERLLSHEATLRLLSGLRLWFYEHLEPLAPAALQSYRSGDLLSRIRADIDALDNFYLRILMPVSVALLACAVFVIFVWQLYAPLVWILLGFLLAAGVAVPVIMARLSRLPGKRLVETAAELRTTVIDGVQGLPELSLYGATRQQASIMSCLGDSLAQDQARLSQLSGLSQGALLLCSQLAMWFVLLLAIPAVSASRMAPAELAMLALFTLASFEAVAPLPLAFQSLAETLASARRIFSLVDQAPLVQEPSGPSPQMDSLDIRFKQVGFRYPASRDWVLQDINLELPAGKKLAVIGATGSGKTSLVNLLLRFWETGEGEITLGNQPLNAYHCEDIRRQIAVVSQHGHLFNASIRQNLLLANPEASQARLEQACRTAQIHNFIQSLPQGYDTQLGEAALRLSGGEARRVAIARALLKDAPILVLDEPAEGLDASTETAMLEALYQSVQDKTVLLISHSLKGLSKMDEIVVLDDGRICERGTHAELLQQQGYYYALRQMRIQN